MLLQVTYTNKKPAYYLNRQFKIVCSELNGRFVSNEYSQTLTVIHPKATEVGDDDDDDDSNVRAGQIPAVSHAHRVLDEQAVDEVGFKQFAIDRAGGGVAHSEYSKLDMEKRVINCVVL